MTSADSPSSPPRLHPGPPMPAHRPAPSTGPTVVIVGAGYAGRNAAVALAKRLKTDATVTLVDTQDRFLERIRLHQMAAGQHFVATSLSKVMPKTVTLMRGELLDINLAARQLCIASEAGQQNVSYDYLVYALGSRCRPSAPGVMEYATPLDGRPLPIGTGQRVLVVGGGSTGIELAAELAEAHPAATVTLATGSNGLDGLTNVSLAGRAYVRDCLTRLGVLVHSDRITQLTAGRAHTAAGDTLPFDHCIWTAGFEVSNIAAASGLTVDRSNRVLVDAYLRAPGHPEVFVVGDAARVLDANGAPLRAACATAMPMGSFAGDTIAATLRGRPLTPFRFGYVMLCISLGRRRGLIERLDHHDRPVGRPIQGRMAAFIKERICRMTQWAPNLERRLGVRVVRYPAVKLWHEVQGSTMALPA